MGRRNGYQNSSRGISCNGSCGHGVDLNKVGETGEKWE